MLRGEMAEALAAELILDIDDLTNRLECLCDRWGKYGMQFQAEISDATRAKLLAAFNRLQSFTDSKEE